MTPVVSKRPPRGAPPPGLGPATLRARPGRPVSGVLMLVRTSVAPLIERTPGTMQATRAGAHALTVALQTLPDSTLRWLAAGSVGFGAGLYLAGAPRVVTAAGVAPALAIAAAIALRPIESKTAPRQR